MDANGTQAAIRAGYSNKSARQQASQNLTNPAIVKAIEEKQAERALRVGVSQDRVLSELIVIGYSNLKAFFDADGAVIPVQDWPDALAGAVQSIEVIDKTDEDGKLVGRTYKIKLWPKLDAIQLIMRHQGMLKDKLAVEVDNSFADMLLEARERIVK